jgi:hypothetical protein
MSTEEAEKEYIKLVEELVAEHGLAEQKEDEAGEAKE